ncbi:MAG TPA: hypothetical protein VF365_03650 [Candidatus Limnocylindria bacterium]
MPRGQMSDQERPFMRKQVIVLMATLAMTPLGAKAADLVVWWEKGYYDQENEAVAEIVAAFEEQTGKQVELVLLDEEELPAAFAAALDAGQPPDFGFGTLMAPLHLGVGFRRPAGRPLGCDPQLREHLRSGCARADHTGQRQDRSESPVRAANRPDEQPRPRLDEPARPGGFPPRRHPARMACVLVVLVQ